MTPFISEAEVQKALDYLRDNASNIGAAKSRLVGASAMLRVVKSIEFLKQEGGPVAEREAKAYASDKYREAVLEEAEAAGAYEEMKSRMKAAEMKIEAWRTQSSTFRSMKL